MIGHASVQALVRFRDGSMAGRERVRLAEHLAACPRCRSELERMKEMVAAVRGLEEPALPAGGFDAVRRRIEAGEAVLLPTPGVREAPGTPAGRRPRRGAARLVASGGVLLAAVVAGVLVRPDRAGGWRSELSLTPARPVAGAEIRVTYQPTGDLSGEDRLVLRARYRRPGSEPYTVVGLQVAADTLTPDGEGAYVGSFRLPEDVVYAAFAVEDLSGERIDANGGRLWDVVTHEADGRPSYRGLLERVTDSYGRSWEDGYAAARRATDLYPDSVAAWTQLDVFESQLVPASEGDSLRSEREKRFGRLHAHYAALSSVDPEVAADLWYLAWGLSGSRIQTRSDEENPDSTGTPMAMWRDRVLESDGFGPRAEMVRSLYACVELCANPAAHLQALDSIWTRMEAHDGPAARALASDAMFSARKVGPEEERKWLLRRLRANPGAERSVGRSLSALPGHEDEGIRLLEEAAGRTGTPQEESRPLSTSREEWRVERVRRRAGVLVDLAEAYVKAGRTADAERTLGEAVDVPWDPDVLTRVAEGFLATGDTAGAVDAYARRAGDPIVPAAFDDSVKTRIPDLDRYHWRQRVDAARDEVASILKARLAVKPYRGEGVAIVDEHGGQVRLREGTGRVTIVSLWSDHCGASLGELSELARFQQEARADGVDHFAVKDGAPSGSDDGTLEEWKASDLSVAYDPDGQVSTAFGVWGTPSHVLLDARGRIRYVTSGTGAFEELRRLAEVLR